MIGVGLVVHNEEKNIQNLLRDLARQDQGVLSKAYVVDNNSSDATIQRIEALRESLPFEIKLIRSKENFIGPARQKILTECEDRFIAFTDGDCRLPSQWLTDLFKNYLDQRQLDPQCVGVGGPNRLPQLSSFQVNVNRMLESPLGHARSPQAYWPRENRLASHLATSNALFEVQACRQVGGFTNEPCNCGEDRRLGQALHSAGYSMYLCPKPVVGNNCAQTSTQWSDRMFRFGGSRLLLDPPSLKFSRLWPCLLVFSLLAYSFPTFFATLSGLYIFSLGAVALKKGRSSLQKRQLAELLVVTHGAFVAGLLNAGFVKIRSFLFRFKDSFHFADFRLKNGTQKS